MIMQVVRNIYKEQRKAYRDGAYNLPIDRVYYIESRWNYRLNDYVRAHRQEIEQVLAEDIGGFFPYRLEVVQAKKASAEEDPAAKEKIYSETAIRRMLSKEPVFEAGFAVRVVPAGDSGTYEFYMIDVSLCSETIVPAILKSYVRDINRINLSVLSGQESRCDYGIHERVQRVERKLPRNGRGISFRGLCGPVEAREDSPAGICTEEIMRLDISPELRALALQIKDAVDAYEASNGKNVFLEGASGQFIRSLEQAETKPASMVEIDSRYEIHLPEYGKTVKMYTMPKTVYVFFLRHPEGVRLKDIGKHKQELMHLYSVLTREGLTPAELEERIDGLLNLQNGNLNQYICRIAEAFRNVLPRKTAQHYIIVGKRNECKKEALDMQKVTLPEKLKF